MKLEFSRQIFENYTNLKFHENPLVGIEFFHAERDDEASRPFRNFANTRNKPSDYTVGLTGTLVTSHPTYFDRFETSSWMQLQEFWCN